METLDVQIDRVAIALRTTETDEDQQTPMLLDAVSMYFTTVMNLVMGNVTTANISGVSWKCLV